MKTTVPTFRSIGRTFTSVCIGAAIGALSLSGCASIMHGTRQDIGIASSPSGADVWIDNIQMGQTPVIEKLTRRDNHIVKIVLPGFQPFEATITHSVSGWVWGNIAFGGLIGLSVDAISGGLYKLSPEQMTGNLLATRAGLPSEYGGAYVGVVMKAEAGWEKVGQLQPL